MKYLSIALSVLLINTSASGAMSPRFYETEILGNWICKDIWPGYSAFEMIRYKKDGTWNSFGELQVPSFLYLIKKTKSKLGIVH